MAAVKFQVIQRLWWSHHRPHITLNRRIVCSYTRHAPKLHYHSIHSYTDKFKYFKFILKNRKNEPVNKAIFVIYILYYNNIKYCIKKLI